MASGAVIFSICLLALRTFPHFKDTITQYISQRASNHDSDEEDHPGQSEIHKIDSNCTPASKSMNLASGRWADSELKGAGKQVS